MKWKELTKLNINKKNFPKTPKSMKDINKIHKYFIDSTSTNIYPKNSHIGIYKHKLQNFFPFVLTTEDVGRILLDIKFKAFGSDKLNITLIILCSPFIIPL